MITKDLGMVTAYAYAVSKGYTGTEEEFAELMASYASVAQEAVDAALAAAQSAQAAESAKDTAQTTVNGAIAGIQAEGQTQVGAVQSEGTAQVGNVNSAGQTQVGNVNAAGTTQVGNVNTAGSTQVSAVQAKGTEVLNSIPSDYTALSGEVSGLKSALNNKADKSSTPQNQDSDAEDVDLDISDTSGNVLVRFEDGHIKTKNFDSSNIETASPVDSVSVRGSADLDLSDEAGNVLVRFEDGHIKTKEFDSTNQYVKERMDYGTTIEYSGAVTVDIDQPFYNGNVLIFHTSIVDNNITDAIGAYLISYYGVTPEGNAVLLCKDYGWNFPKVTINRDFSKIRVALPNGLTWGETKSVRAMVYHSFGTDVKKREIIVRQDGYGHYTNLKDALNSITDNNALTQYVVKVYPGTYNVLDDFTDEEILAEGFKGLIVMNGVYIEGVGQRDDIVINGHLEGSSYDTVRNNISPFNMAGDSGLSNMVINADHMRYCIHDDIGSSASRTHVFRNLTLRASDMTSASAYAISFGAGYGNMKNMYFENVDFGDAMSAHGTTGWTYSPRIVLENCTAKIFNFTDYDSVENVYIKMNNCKGVAVRIAHSSGELQKIRLDGVGTDLIMDCYAGFVYNLGQCLKYEDSYNFDVGQAVKLGTSYSLVATTDKANMFGIVLGKLDGDTYIQTGGYLDANTFGITGLSVGDYVHLDANGVLSSGGSASDAVGIVIGANGFQGGAFIKML